jgi:hypothetical protein
MKAIGSKYDIPKGWTDTYENAIDYAESASLEQWAADPNCVQNELCATEIEKRRKKKEAIAETEKAIDEAESSRLAKRREKLESYPFDPRTEVSADAKHIAGRIVKHLWILFVLLPAVAFLLWALADAMK